MKCATSNGKESWQCGTVRVQLSFSGSGLGLFLDNESRLLDIDRKEIEH